MWWKAWVIRLIISVFGTVLPRFFTRWDIVSRIKSFNSGMKRPRSGEERNPKVHCNARSKQGEACYI
jgi:hypothetical protein